VCHKCKQHAKLYYKKKWWCSVESDMGTFNIKGIVKTKRIIVQIVTIDFETFYDTGFSLSRMTTEEYIQDDQFQVIGVAIKINDDKTEWYIGDDCAKALAEIDWANSMLLCHNTQFDGAILKWYYGFEPAGYFDTLSIARALHGINAGGSLKALAERYKLGEKGTEVVDAKGMRLEDFPEHQLRQYGVYCKNDVKLTYDLFKVISMGFPIDELKLIDITLKMFISPTLQLDTEILKIRLQEVKQGKTLLLEGLMKKLACDSAEAVRKKLASNKQFAELLCQMGVPCPMKISPTTGKETYALAKNDTGFMALTEHEDIFIQELCNVRLGTKSTMEEARIERFISIATRNNNQLPIPLKYYGAHTGRWAGIDKVNFQNLPSRDKKKKALKNAILPPDGHVIMNVDSSQIEARILVWLAGQHDVVEQFRKGEDVYSVFASKVFNREVSKKTPTERFIGKTCVLGLGYGTGAKKLQHTLKTSPPGADLSDQECQRIVKVYRDVNHEVIKLWDKCDKALKFMASWPEGKPFYYLDNRKSILVTPGGLRLPNGLYIYYPDLEWKTDESVRGGYVYKSRHGQVNIWGGAMVENVVQALARIVVGEQMIAINERYKPVLTVHDAIICTAPKDEAQEALDFLMAEMSKAPAWAEGLPITCEGGYGDNYGDC
jgi:DNA polymerase I-like protein with 3'-5' exonuclease and polymerase domains